ncbi:hypothetical protein V8068_001166 [Vibrio parahaemolyticus]|nr:hypothetical protein [Vibrio parahaemolyticus]EHV9720284.1 hypothetical protein [Vibrio parahaemolyticus]
MTNSEAMNLPVGSKVNYYPVLGEDRSKATTTLSNVFPIGGDMAVMVEGVSGCVSVENLELCEQNHLSNNNEVITELRDLVGQCCGTCAEKKKILELIEVIDQQLTN